MVLVIGGGADAWDNSIAGSLLSLATLLTLPARALEIQQFDRMAAKDRQDYMNFLPEAAQKVLIAQGRKDDRLCGSTSLTEPT